MQHTIDREMSVTHDEFFRLLPYALKKRNYKIVNTIVLVDLKPGRLKISLSPQSQKAIGSLLLPTIHVSFDFKDCTEKMQEDFFEDFDLAYQKGGG